MSKEDSSASQVSTIGKKYLRMTKSTYNQVNVLVKKKYHYVHFISLESKSNLKERYRLLPYMNVIKWDWEASKIKHRSPVFMGDTFESAAEIFEGVPWTICEWTLSTDCRVKLFWQIWQTTSPDAGEWRTSERTETKKERSCHKLPCYNISLEKKILLRLLDALSKVWNSFYWHCNISLNKICSNYEIFTFSLKLSCKRNFISNGN